MKGLLGGTFTVLGYLLFGSDDKKKSQIINYAKKTIPTVKEDIGKLAGIAVEAGVRGAVEGAKNGSR